MLSSSDLELTRLAALLGARLRATSRRLVTAESCTGGWVAKACTDLAGSSAWFECGFVTYSNEAKQRDLGVDTKILQAHGAVSEPTVIAMARGAARRAQAQVSIAISGIAGPEGGTTDKPVGTVWLAIGAAIGEKFEVKTRLSHFTGDRDDVRRGAALRAFELAIEFIQ